MTKAPVRRWPLGIVLLHWSAALLTLATAGYAIYLLSPPDWSQRYIDRYMAGIAWHKTGGIAVLALALCWIAVRLRAGRPPLHGSPALRAAARAAHGALLLSLVVLPVSGYLADALAGNDLRLIGGIAIPRFLGADEGIGILLSQVHKWGGFALLGLVGLHVLGAVRHAFTRGDATLRAMAPW